MAVDHALEHCNTILKSSQTPSPCRTASFALHHIFVTLRSIATNNMRSSTLSVLALIAQTVFATPAVSSKCGGQYRHYPPASSYCAANFPPKSYTTTVSATLPISTVTATRSTVYGSDRKQNRAHANHLNRITASPVTILDSITPDSATTTTTISTTSTQIADTSTITQTDISTVSRAFGASRNTHLGLLHLEDLYW